MLHHIFTLPNLNLFRYRIDKVSFKLAYILLDAFAILLSIIHFDMISAS